MALLEAAVFLAKSAPRSARPASTCLMNFVLKPFVLLLAPVVASAAILPGTLGPYQQTAAAPVVIQNTAFWNELGLTAAERGSYAAGGKKVTVTAWRVADTTSGLAAYDSLLPEGAKGSGEKLSGVTALSSDIPGGILAALGNTVVQIDGYQPTPDELANFFRSIPKFEQGPLPLLPGYLPAGSKPASQRFVTGPNALAQFLPQIPPSVAAFSLGAEADLATYGDGQKLAVFSYPTPAIARDRLPLFQKIPGILAKRTGTLVVLVVSQGDPNADERLLSQVKYQASVTLGNKPVTAKDNPGNLFLNIVYLVLILSGFCIVSGVVVGGLRYILRRSGSSGDGDQMIALHLEKR